MEMVYRAVQMEMGIFSGAAWGWRLLRLRRRESDGGGEPDGGGLDGQSDQGQEPGRRPRRVDIMENKTAKPLLHNDLRLSIIHLMTSTLTCITLAIDDTLYRSIA